MGCDIHLYKEKLVNGKWMTADEWGLGKYGQLEVKNETSRDYNLFGALAKNVMRESDFAFEPRGFPFNACDEVVKEANVWGSDGHHHSYLYLHELKEKHAFLDDLARDGQYDEVCAHLKTIIEAFSGVDGDDHRIVFFFDN